MNTWAVTWLGYGNGAFAPGVRSNEYLVSHNIIKAHATAWHTYDDVYRFSQSGITYLRVSW